MRRSNRSISRLEYNPVPTIVVGALALGIAFIALSWVIESAHEEALSNNTPTPHVSKEASNENAADETSQIGSTTQTVLSNPAASVSLLPSWTDHKWKLVSKGSAELGLALISVGLIAVLLEVRVMSDYFEGKIARSMSGSDYLKRLTQDQLDQLQVDSLRAYWGLGEKDRADLLDFCKEQVHGFLGAPYREDMRGAFTVEPIKENENEVEVTEQLSWTCRVIKEKIQREVRWSTGIDEIRDLQQFRITLEVPPEVWNDEFKSRHPRILKMVTEFDMHKPKKDDGTVHVLVVTIKRLFEEFWTSQHSTKQKQSVNSNDADKARRRLSKLRRELDARWSVTDLKKLSDHGEPECEGYKLTLADYHDVDQLHVSVYAKYKAPVGRSLTWQMSHPTRKVSGYIEFKERRFFLETFGLAGKYLYRDKSRTNSYSFEYKSWLLPECGFVLHFLPLPKAD